MRGSDNIHKTYHRNKTVTVMFICVAAFMVLIGRLVYLMVFQSEYYIEKAKELHERERTIKAARGRIIDANGEILADNKTVCTISVIHNQIEDPETVIKVLSEELGLSEEYVRGRVEKYSSIEKIKSNVDKSVGDAIRSYELPGVKVDEDYKRYYPYDSLASKVLGFTGGDNQGIIGLEVIYDEYLQGEAGRILTDRCQRGGSFGRRRRAYRTYKRQGSVYQSGYEYPELCHTACCSDDGDQAGKECFDHCYESAERGTYGDGQCAGI